MTEIKPVPPPPSRRHLVERAAAAMGGLAGLEIPLADIPKVSYRSEATVHTQERRRAQPEARAARADVALQPATAAPASELARPSVTLAVLRQAGLAIAPIGGRSRVSEEISVVQHQLLRNFEAPKLEDRRGRVVLVTSARPGEGKTFTALNVAAALALGGRPVVLVDADAKSGALGSLLGCNDRAGLRALAGDPLRHAASLVLPTEMPRLDFLPFGAAEDGSEALPAAAALAGAVLRVADAFPGAAIVLDTTPCLSTGDPGALASVAGQVVLVVEAELTKRNEVEAALDMVEACPILQLVLNKARLTANDTFGAYYGS